MQNQLKMSKINGSWENHEVMIKMNHNIPKRIDNIFFELSSQKRTQAYLAEEVIEILLESKKLIFDNTTETFTHKDRANVFEMVTSMLFASYDIYWDALPNPIKSYREFLQKHHLNDCGFESNCNIIFKKVISVSQKNRSELLNDQSSRLNKAIIEFLISTFSVMQRESEFKNWQMFPYETYCKQILGLKYV